MRNEYIRYFLGFLVAIGLIILIIFLLFSGNGGNKSSSTSKPATLQPLYSYADTDTVARMVINGPTTAPQNRTEVQVTVGRDEATYQQIQGYDGNIVNSQSTPNTRNSYEVFLRSLATAGFKNGDNNPDLTNSAGYCPLGTIYTFQLIQNGTYLINYWATSCGGTKTYHGNVGTTTTLFQNQIPGYNDLTQSLAL